MCSRLYRGDDTFTFGAIVWKAPAGSHWAFVSKTIRDGPNRSDCADFEEKYLSLYPDPIVISFAITEECRTARDDLESAKDATAAAKKKAKKAHGKKAKKKTGKALKAAKAKQKKAQTAYNGVCS